MKIYTWKQQTYQSSFFRSIHVINDVHNLIDRFVVSKLSKDVHMSAAPIELGQNWSYYILRQVLYISRYFSSLHFASKVITFEVT